MIGAIETENLVKKFPRKVTENETGQNGNQPKRRFWPWGTKPEKAWFTAVDGVNLQIEQGEIFGLLGPNGAGKSTTIRMLCTLLEPTSGTARVSGFDVVKQAALCGRTWGRFWRESAAFIGS